MGIAAQDQEDLRTNEERLRLAMEATRQGVWDWSTATGQLYLSPVVHSFLGMEPEEMPDRLLPLLAFIHPDDRRAAWDAWMECGEGRLAEFEVEFRLRHKNGTWRWMKDHGKVVERSPDGCAARVVGTITDITGRKQVEEALDHTSSRLNILMENLQVGILFEDEDRRIVYANRRFCDLFGIPMAPSELAGLDCSQAARQCSSRFASPEAFITRVEEILDLGQPVNDEELVLADGRVFSRDYTPILARGRPIGHLWQLRDQTGPKRIEAELRASELHLRESEEKYRSVVERANDGILIVQDERVVFLNRRLAELWGGPPEEVIGRAFTDFIAPEAVGQVAERYRLRLSGENVPSTYTTVLVDKERRRIDVEINAGMLLYEGRPSDMVFVRDIRERRQAEAQRALRLAELEAVNRLSTALRAARTLDEMLPRLVDETLAILNTTVGAVWLHDANSGRLSSRVARGWFTHLEQHTILPGEGIGGRVFQGGRPYFCDDYHTDPHTRDISRQAIPPGWSGVCVPISTINETVGVFFVALPHPRRVTPEETHLLAALAEIAGSAINRMRLHAQAERHVQRLSALRKLDLTIAASQDLRLTLDVLLEQAVAQLQVDAACVLLYNSAAQALEFSAGYGFRGSGHRRVRLTLGQMLAGRAALDRKILAVPDFSQAAEVKRPSLLAKEGFNAYFGVPLISKGKIEGVLELLHRAPLAPDPEWLEFVEMLAGQAATAINEARLFESLQRSNTELKVAYDSTIEGWARALEMRDQETEGHSLRVTEMTLELARAMGITAGDRLADIRRGAFLHDIGKMGIPDSILLKPAPLTHDEWCIMRRHPEFAHIMLAPIEYLRPALDIPLCHHERWDGSGYPRRLKGEEIPLAARIFAVVDVWDALISNRPYRPAWPPEKARAYLVEHAGADFDPKVVEAFLPMIGN